MAWLSPQQLDTIRQCCKDEAAFETVQAVLAEAGPPVNLDLFFTEMPDAIVEFDAQGHIQQIGWTPARPAAPRPVPQRKGAELTVTQAIRRAFQTQQPVWARFVLPSDQGGKVFDYVCMPVKDESGNVQAVNLWCPDLSPAEATLHARLHRLEALIQAQTQSVDAHNARAQLDSAAFEALLDGVGNIVVVLSPEGRIVRFNTAAQRFTGYSAEEVKGRFVWDFFLREEDIPQVKDVFNGLRAGLAPGREETIWKTRPDAERLVEWNNTIVPDDHGNVRYVIGSGTDVTDRQKMFEALRRSEAELAAIFDSSTQAMLIINSERQIVHSNKLARQWGEHYLGRFPREGVSIYELMPPDRRISFDRLFTRALKGQIILEEYEMRLLSGERRLFEVRFSPVVTQDNRRLGVCISVLDIAHRAEAREQNQALKKNHDRVARLTYFVHSAAQRLRTPMAVIESNMYMLGRYVAQHTPPPEPPYFANIQAQKEVILQVVQDLVMLARLDTDDTRLTQRFDLNALVRLACGGVGQRLAEARIRLETDLASDLPQLQGDVYEVEQLIAGLVGNLRDFVPSGGLITLQTTQQGDNVCLIASGGDVWLTEVQQRELTDRFERGDARRARHGFGPSLAVIRRIVDTWDGEIKKECTPPHLAFRVQLPGAPVEDHSSPDSMPMREQTS